MKTKLFRSFLVLAVLLVAVVPTALADNGTDTSALRAVVTTDGIKAHLDAFQAIAEANGGNRVAGSSGYNASAEYVITKLLGAGYSPQRQYFNFDLFEELSNAVLEQTSPGAESYEYGVDFYTMEYSGSGDVPAAVQAVDLLLPPVGGSTSGCEGKYIEVGSGGFGNFVLNTTGINDFEVFVPGNIALIQRGSCTFALKALNAKAAGALGVIIFNEGNTPDREDLLNGTLGGLGVGEQSIDIPVVGTTYALGVELNNLVDDLTLHMMASTQTTSWTTYNVIAETSGRTDRAVVVGAHLDSAPQGPGINDNGSGSAAILEIALQMADLGIEPRNQVRFIWFSAEESGLIGSQFYVDHLSKQQVKDIAVMLNFDMIASKVYERFVYDGDGSSLGTAGPNGSGVVEDVFLNYFSGVGLDTMPTEFDGRSDYDAFINAGIPAGGLFTGAEGYDECYHKACDDMSNIDDIALEEMSDAAAHTILTFAMTTSAVNGTDKGKGSGTPDFEYLGSNLKK